MYIYIYTCMQEWCVVLILLDQGFFKQKKMTSDSLRIIQMVSLNSAYEPWTQEPATCRG